MWKYIAVAVATGLAISAPAAADEGVTPEAVIAKVREAAAHLAKEGAAGLADFEKEGSPFVWAPGNTKTSLLWRGGTSAHQYQGETPISCDRSYMP